MERLYGSIILIYWRFVVKACRHKTRELSFIVGGQYCAPVVIASFERSPMKFFLKLFQGRRVILVLLTFGSVLSARPTSCEAKGYVVFGRSSISRSADVIVEYLDAQRGTVERIAKLRDCQTTQIL